MCQKPFQNNWSFRSGLRMLNMWLWLYWFFPERLSLMGVECVCQCAVVQNAHWNTSELSTCCNHTREQELQLHHAHLLLFGFRCLFPSWKTVLIPSKAVQAFPQLRGTPSSIMTLGDGRLPPGQKSPCCTDNRNKWLECLSIRMWLDPDLCLLIWCLGQTT